MKARFESIGSYLPEKKVSTQDLVDKMAFKVPIDLAEFTGIHSRHVHSKDPDTFEGSYTLAMKAARDCLAGSRYEAQDLDVVISTSITRFKDDYRIFFEPTMASAICRGLGIESCIQFDMSNHNSHFETLCSQ